MPKTDRLAIVSIDVETDWGGRLPPAPAGLRGVERGLPEIMDRLDAAGVRATLFASGSTVPFVTKQLAQAAGTGHEIASHAFTHRRLPELPAPDLDEEISRSKAALEEAVGREVHGFRAPQARFPKGLLDRLVRHGYVYDSSVFGGFFPTRFRNLRVPREPYLASGLWEVPVSSLPLLPLPMGLLWVDRIGLGPLRLAWFLARPSPFLHFYLHPFDVIEPYAAAGIPVAARLWYSRGPGSALATLGRLLAWARSNGYVFVTAREAVERAARAPRQTDGS